MRGDPSCVDSGSAGDPGRFVALEDLERGLASLAGAPQDAGRVGLLVRRLPNGGLRETPDRLHLTPEGGIPGDAWGRGGERSLDAQIAVMELDVALLIANGQPLALFGDGLFLDLDLSAANLPPGSRLRAGAALLEVTPKPHDGCRKFRARFGPGALLLVSKPDLRHRNLRGIYVRVVEPGDVARGDAVRVTNRGPPPHA